ncbi:hypothetical protein L798_10308 [Zootermopsis nevadensis]|uniref:Uncharacterized protein n=1 Tax=Zootermopsis nevadensis TaxID=136037 RepID=A0A067R886_ZOONE|nr:hypothetical protein L798_10308 [Zootermopsis nevadensis]
MKEEFVDETYEHQIQCRLKKQDFGLFRNATCGGKNTDSKMK